MFSWMAFQAFTLAFLLDSFSPTFFIPTFKREPFRRCGLSEGEGSAVGRPSNSVHVGAVVLGPRTQRRSEEGNTVL